MLFDINKLLVRPIRVLYALFAERKLPFLQDVLELKLVELLLQFFEGVPGDGLPIIGLIVRYLHF